eukprot:252557-Prorocentrum_lima.AAC.1
MRKQVERICSSKQRLLKHVYPILVCALPSLVLSCEDLFIAKLVCVNNHKGYASNLLAKSEVQDVHFRQL